MTRIILLSMLALALVGAGLVALNASRDEPPLAAQVALPHPVETEADGFARALGPYDWQFPADHGPHPAFQTEWWYYTGNLESDSGRRFGFQFTIFRRAIAPGSPASSSEWRSNEVYMAHFTLSDVAQNQFHEAQRFSRGGAGLAGATTEPRFRVWLEDWESRALNADATQTQITAAMGGVAIDLALRQVKPPTLQGDHGLSAKGSQPGNASYYYSLSRLVTAGTITLNGEPMTVTGATWMDHEFSTGALGDGVEGWDWFGLHLDGNRELMVGMIRLRDGGQELYGGALILPDGSAQNLDASDFAIEATGAWTSPHSGATYPAGWVITVDSAQLRLTLTPLMADQELTEGAIIYWEGAVRITGDATGYGYAELTGYQATMRGWF